MGNNTYLYQHRYLSIIKVIFLITAFLLSTHSFAAEVSKTLIIKNTIIEGTPPTGQFEYEIKCNTVKYSMDYTDIDGVATNTGGYTDRATNFFLAANEKQSITIKGDAVRKHIYCTIKEIKKPGTKADLLFKGSINTDFGLPVSRSTQGLVSVVLARYRDRNANIADLKETTTIEFKYKAISPENPEGIKLKAEVFLPNGGPNNLGPIKAEVICLQAGNPRWFRKEISSADREVSFSAPTFGVNKNKLRCVIVPRAVGEQRKFFRFSRGDNADTISNGAISVGDASTVNGKKLWVTFDYSSDELVTMKVRKVTPTGDGDKGPFDVKVSCNGSERIKNFEFEMAGVADPADDSEDESFQYKKGRLACVIRETLTETQKGFFVQKSGDTQGTDNGVIRGTTAVSTDAETLTMTNTYYPDGVVSMNVKKSTPEGIGDAEGQKGPFDISVRCVGSGGLKQYDFSLKGDDTASFQYPKPAGGAEPNFRCAVLETLTTNQRQFFTTEFSNDQGIRPKSRVLYHNATHSAEGKTLTVTNTYHPDGVISMEVEKLVPVPVPVVDGEEKEPFDVKVRCLGNNGRVDYDFKMDGGDKLSFQYPKLAAPKVTAFRCVVLETLTADQRQFFTTELSNDQGIRPKLGVLYHNATHSAEDKTLTVTNTYHPDGVVNMEVEKLVPVTGGEDKELFDVKVRCIGNSGRMDYEFEMGGDDKRSFQYPKRPEGEVTAFRCAVLETLTTDQRQFFKTEFSNDQGIRPKSRILYHNASHDAEGKKLTVTNTYHPDGVISMEVEKLVPVTGGEDKEPFDVKVRCLGNNGRVDYDFEMGGGDKLSFQYPQLSVPQVTAFRCVVLETLTADQRQFFKTELSNNQGIRPKLGVLYHNATHSAEGKTLTVTNTYHPDGVVNMEVEKLVPVTGGEDKEPFDVKVRCIGNSGRMDYEFEMGGDDKRSFQYPKRPEGEVTAFRCAVLETLTTDQRQFFKTEFSNDQGIRPKSRILYHNATHSAEGKTLTVTNIYHPDGVISMEVEKLVPVTVPVVDGEEKEPFDVKVRCLGNNGRVDYDFKMDGGDKLSFQYPKLAAPKVTAFRCVVLETLTADQRQFFTTELSNDQGIRPKLGVLYHNATHSAEGKTLTVTNTYHPDGVVNMEVEKLVPVTGGEDKEPFDVKVRCIGNSGRMDYEFEMGGDDKRSFQYPKRPEGEVTAFRCAVLETLTTDQRQFFKTELSNDQGIRPKLGVLYHNATHSAEGKTLTVTNIYHPNGVISMDVKKLVAVKGGEDKGPFDVKIRCIGNSGRTDYEFEMEGGDQLSFQYPKFSKGKTAFRCVVLETLTADQRQFFKTELSNDQGIRPKLGVLYHNATHSAKDKTLTVTNIYHPNGVISMDVEKLVPAGGEDKGPFDIKVSCLGSDGLHEYEYEMESGDKLSFQYPQRSNPANTRFRCEAKEILRTDQRDYFKTTYGNDHRRPKLGVLYHNQQKPATDKKITVTNTYFLKGVNTYQVVAKLPEGRDDDADTDYAPFLVKVKCRSNGDDYEFELNHSDKAVFQYEKNTYMDCKVTGGLLGTQQGKYAINIGDTAGPSNGSLRGNSDDVAATRNAPGAYAGRGIAIIQSLAALQINFLPDADGDGISNTDEVANGTDPNNADEDGNGVIDGLDDADGDGLSNSDEINFNHTNFRRADSDGDGISDASEVTIGGDPNNADEDGNGIPDGRDDSDGDGITDASELALGTDPNNGDEDGNGILDGHDDSDGDGIPQIVELRLGLNPDNRDSDGDGVPDGEEDTNGDGFVNLYGVAFTVAPAPAATSIPVLNPLSLFLLILSLLGFGLRKRKV